MLREAQKRPLKELAREIFLATLAEVDVARAWARKVERRGSELRFGGESVDLSAFRQRWVVSFGKAAWAMVRALLDTLGEEYQPQRGVVVSNLPPKSVPAGFRAFQGGHPYPNAQSLEAAEAILELLRGADERTLVFFLISGGGSALVERPLDYASLDSARDRRGKSSSVHITLEDLAELNRVLVGCGASIEEMNAIRKHLSAVKGGRLAEAAGRAHTVTFLVSDVPEGKLDAIASGPTRPDPTTTETCYEVAAHFALLDKFPAAIRALFEGKKLAETPKAEAEAFRRAQSFLLLSSHDLLHAAHRAAGARGFLAECEMTCDDWELERAGACLLGRLEELQRENPGKPVCLISGGEIRVPVPLDTGHGPRVASRVGIGGRNQAFALHCVEKIAGRDVAVLSAGTDGIDGSSPAAGAVADGETRMRASAQGLNPEDYFRRSDSFHFFDALGDTIVTGPQENNLRDLRLLLAR